MFPLKQKIYSRWGRRKKRNKYQCYKKHKRKNYQKNKTRKRRFLCFYFCCCFYYSLVASSKPSSSTVADLVHGLIKLGSVLKSCEEDQAKAVQCEVATCLGEIGAVDLSTVSLRCKDAETGN